MTIGNGAKSACIRLLHVTNMSHSKELDKNSRLAPQFVKGLCFR